MAINIYKRTRAVRTDRWGVWAITTDVPPYINTDLIDYQVQDSTTIDLQDLTYGSITKDADGMYVWQGSGIFDVLMNAVNSNVKAEYDNGRLVGTEYATVYLGALQSTLQQSSQLWLQKQLTAAQTDVEKDKLTTAIKNREVMDTQKALYNRQRAGFDDNKYQKTLDTQLNAWGITFQDTDTTFIPGAVGGAGGAAGDAEFDTSLAAVRASYE